MSSPKDKRLLEGANDIMGLKHYSIHTERSYCDYITAMPGQAQRNIHTMVEADGSGYSPEAG